MAGLNENILNLMATTFASNAAYLAVHTADPGTTGANASSAPRVAAGWSAPSQGDVTATNKTFTGGAANGPAAFIGYWSALTGGTFYGSRPTAGGTNDTTFNAAGEFVVNSITENGASA